MASSLYALAGETMGYSPHYFEFCVAARAVAQFADTDTADLMLSKMHYVETYSQFYELQRIVREKGIFTGTLDSAYLLKLGFPLHPIQLPARVKRAGKPTKAAWQGMLNKIDIWFWQAEPSAVYCRLWLVELEDYVEGRTVKMCAAAAVELPDDKAVAFAKNVARILKGAKDDELKQVWTFA